MNTVYISLFYMRMIIRQQHPNHLAVLGSPSPLVGGWMVTYPTKRK